MKVLKLMSPCCVSVVKRSKELLHIDTPEWSADSASGDRGENLPPCPKLPKEQYTESDCRFHAVCMLMLIPMPTQP